MSDKIQDYIQKVKKQELIKRGLYEIKYYDANEVTKEMERTLEYNDAQHKYYELIPFEITEEQFAELIKYPMLNKKSGNKVTATFYVTATIIFLIGAASGFSLSQSFDWNVALSIWFASFCSGMIFIGLGKIIDLLSEIRN